jgi:hypothetical protein
MQIKQKLATKEANAYSLFMYAVRSPVTRDYYLRRLRTFFDHINLSPHNTMEDRCNLFAARGSKDPRAEAYFELEKWMEYRKESGENIDENSWVMRQLWNTKEGHYHHGTTREFHHECGFIYMSGEVNATAVICNHYHSQGIWSIRLSIQQ